MRSLPRRRGKDVFAREDIGAGIGDAEIQSGVEPHHAAVAGEEILAVPGILLSAQCHHVVGLTHLEIGFRGRSGIRRNLDFQGDLTIVSRHEGDLLDRIRPRQHQPSVLHTLDLTEALDHGAAVRRNLPQTAYRPAKCQQQQRDEAGAETQAHRVRQGETGRRFAGGPRPGRLEGNVHRAGGGLGD
jgi:hypothetical protein